jgi:methyl-accepting chemotaxis protein
MTNWTIGKRLIVGFSVVIVIILVFGANTWWQMAGIGQRLDRITRQSVPELQMVEAMRYQAALLRVVNFKYLMYEAAQRTELEKEIQKDEATLAEVVTRYQTHVRGTEQQTLFNRIAPLLEAYRAETRRLRESAAQRNAETTKALLASAGQIGNEFIQVVDGLRDYSTKECGASAEQIETTLLTAKWAVMVLNVLVLGASLAIAWYLTRGIAGVLQRVVRELGAGVEQTSAAAAEVAHSSQSLAEGASEQAASIEETSSSLEELASMTKSNAQNAQQVNSLAKQSRIAADKGAADMQSMSEAMEAIKASSDDIAKIIKTIDEIAFQTNILALNAAVEAARAGEAGMGFAVVADEVRSLAQRSAEAAKETAAKIEGAIGKTGQGVEISRKVAEALQEIVTKVRRVDELAAAVAQASGEQSQGIEQINTAVSHVDKVTQGNAASAEESAAAAEELTAQAATMKQSVAGLLQLVGGLGDEPVLRAAEPAPRLERSRAGSLVVKPSGASHGNGRRSVPSPNLVQGGGGTGPSPKAESRRREIPLEGEFKDF